MKLILYLIFAIMAYNAFNKTLDFIAEQKRLDRETFIIIAKITKNNLDK